MWTPQQKAFCVSQYISAGSFLEAQRPGPLTHLISNPPDFFYLGYLKDRVFANHPLAGDDLNTNISREIGQILK